MLIYLVAADVFYTLCLPQSDLTRMCKPWLDTLLPLFACFSVTVFLCSVVSVVVTLLVVLNSCWFVLLQNMEQSETVSLSRCRENDRCTAVSAYCFILVTCRAFFLRWFLQSETVKVGHGCKNNVLLVSMLFLNVVLFVWSYDILDLHGIIIIDVTNVFSMHCHTEMRIWGKLCYVLCGLHCSLICGQPLWYNAVLVHKLVPWIIFFCLWNCDVDIVECGINLLILLTQQQYCSCKHKLHNSSIPKQANS